MQPLPYCGSPPLPSAVPWNADPVLAGLLLLAAAALLYLCAQAPRDALRAAAGWAIAALALLSPLCSLSVALFSARVLQHLLLTLVAAPLLAFAFSARRRHVGSATSAFAITLWAWHLPGPYVATFFSSWLYWLMQASLLGSAVWLFVALRRAAMQQPWLAGLAALLTAVHMSLLGALLTLAPWPLFAAVHRPEATLPWHLTPLQDQQLGGLLMWVPGGVLFGICCAAILLAAMRPGGPAIEAP